MADLVMQSRTRNGERAARKIGPIEQIRAGIQVGTADDDGGETGRQGADPSSAASELIGLRRGAQNASTQCAIAFKALAADSPAGNDTVSSGS